MNTWQETLKHAVDMQISILDIVYPTDIEKLYFKIFTYKNLEWTSFDFFQA